MHQLGESEVDPAMLTLCERIISTLDPKDGGYFRASLRDLLPVFRAVEVDERGDGADLRLLPHLLHESLRADAWRQDEKHCRDAKGAEKRVA